MDGLELGMQAEVAVQAQGFVGQRELPAQGDIVGIAHWRRHGEAVGGAPEDHQHELLAPRRGVGRRGDQGQGEAETGAGGQHPATGGRPGGSWDWAGHRR